MGSNLKKRDVIITVAVALLLTITVMIPNLPNAEAKSARLKCVQNLKQVGLSYRIWANDSSDKYVMQYPEQYGGSLESALGGDVVPTYPSMSNELSTPSILTCPSDERVVADSWTSLGLLNISYFIGIDAVDVRPNMILSGDRNIAIAGKPIFGLIELGTNTSVAFTRDMHDKVGNIGLADGSVQQVTSELLRQQLRKSGDSTNRLIFPQ